MKNYSFISTRDLKNCTNKILHAAEEGHTIVVTRYGKPVATIKPFQGNDLKVEKLSLYQKVKLQIGKQLPQLLEMSKEDLRKLNDEISAKIDHFPTWEEMDRTAKGDDYGLSR
jgi:prevent-host-death family protein